jgi:3,4-dihydroxy 2-butanone 4-phosphate synthase/GTP cyclohydrolase II
VITNNPDKVQQLTDRGITVSEQVPIIVGVGSFNEGYLETKRNRMGHLLPDAEVQAELQTRKEQAL